MWWKICLVFTKFLVGFHVSFAIIVACQKRMLTPPDTGSYLFWDLRIMFCWGNYHQNLVFFLYFKLQAPCGNSLTVLRLFIVRCRLHVMNQSNIITCNEKTWWNLPTTFVITANNTIRSEIIWKYHILMSLTIPNITWKGKKKRNFYLNRYTNIRFLERQNKIIEHWK